MNSEEREKIENWIKEKLKKGVEPSVIKEVLKEKGYDPKIVDEVLSKSDEISFKNKTNFGKKLFVFLLFSCIIFASSYYFFFFFTASPSLSVNMAKRVLTHVGDRLNVTFYLKNPTNNNVKVLEVKVIIRSEENKSFIYYSTRSRTMDYLKKEGVNITFPEEVSPHTEEKIYWFGWEHAPEEPTGKYDIFGEVELEKLGKLKAHSTFDVKTN